MGLDVMQKSKSVNRAAKRHQKKLARKVAKNRRGRPPQPLGQGLGGALANQISELVQKGVQLHQAGQVQEAETIYRQVLDIDPDHADANHLLGVLLSRVGNHGQAVELISRAIAMAPDQPAYYSNLGNVLKRMGRPEEAVANYHKALAIKPDYADAHSNLGAVLQELGRLEEAVASYHKALAIKPDYADAHNNLGDVLKRMGRLEEAVASYHKALAIKPDYAEAHVNLGNVLADLGRLDDALASYRRALAIKPGYASAHNNLGTVLQELGRLEEAVASYHKALAIKPDYADAHNNLGDVLQKQGRLEEAVAACYKALAIKPDYAEAHVNLGNVLTSLGRFEEAVASYRKALAIKPDHVIAHSNLLFSLQCDPKQDRTVIFEEHKRWNARHAAQLTAAAGPHANDPNPDRRLRIGLVSGGFRCHPVGFFLTSVLEMCDKSAVEMFAYSGNPHSDFLTERIRAAVDTWRFIGGMADEAVAATIRADAIDILIDLAGHGSDHRLLVFARKPAPVQAKWVGGQWNTTGMEAIDYFITDAVETPPGDEAWFVEQILRLPDVYTCYTPPDYSPGVVPLPALDRGYVTFGCYNNLIKINPGVVKVWSELMRRVADSRLILKTKQLGDEVVRKRFHAMFEENGIAVDRVDLLGPSNHAELLAMYNGIDIALDPFPFSGCMTTCEALWMGVPVVTIPGETFAERHSASFLTAVGLTDWVVETPHAYVTLLERWCNDLEKLADLREGLRARVQASPLCDYRTFARNLEDAYRDIWRKWCKTSRHPQEVEAPTPSQAFS